MYRTYCAFGDIDFAVDLDAWEKTRELLKLFRKIHYSIKIRYPVPNMYRIFKSGFE